MEKRKSTIVSLAALTVLVGASSALLVRVVPSQELKRASFTATKTERFYGPKGELVRTEEFVDAVRSDGSTVTVRRVPDPNGVLVEKKAILDILARRQVSVDPLTESTSTAQLNDERVHELSHKPTSCTEESAPPGSIGPRTGQRAVMLGYDVVLFERDLPGVKGERRHVELWRAPALDCFPLKTTFLIGVPGGTMVVTNARDVTFIVPGEPQASLFEIPSGYTERAPSEILAEFQRRYPSNAQAVCPTCSGTSELDNRYRRRKPAGK